MRHRDRSLEQRSRRAAEGASEQHEADRASLAELRRRLDEAGIFADPSSFHLARGLALCALFVLGFIGLLLARPGAPWTAAIALSALVMVLSGILAHECGHGAISRRRWVNEIFGYVGMSLMSGLGFSRWRHAHAHHHRTTQDESADPDMQFGLVLSVYGRSAQEKHGIARWMRPAQGIYFWPMTLLYWTSLRWNGFTHVFRHGRCGRIDALLLPLHYLLWLVLPAHVLGIRLAVLNYVLVSCLAASTTAAVFVVNHLGMPVLQRGHGWSYLRQQIEASRNIRANRIWDHFFGGLNFHIEHHLFPWVSYEKLRAASQIVRTFCQEKKIAYREESFGAAVVAATRHLHAMGRIDSTHVLAAEVHR